MMCARQGRRARRTRCACASSASPTRSPRTSTSARPTSSCGDGLARRLRDHRRADRPAHRRRRPRACSRCASRCRGRAAHGSTPWLGDNAVLKAHRRLPPRSRRCRSRASPRSCSTARRSTSARIEGGDAFNKVPDRCAMDVDIRYLPGQDPGEILAQIRAIPRRRRSSRTLHPRARDRRRARNPYVRALRDAVGALDRGRGAERRPRRRLRRDLVPRGRHPGGRVRPGRRRPPRPRGVGLDLRRSRATARRSATSCATLPDAARARARGRRERPARRSTGGLA